VFYVCQSNQHSPHQQCPAKARIFNPAWAPVRPDHRTQGGTRATGFAGELRELIRN
jgi:hypothetical protein